MVKKYQKGGPKLTSLPVTTGNYIVTATDINSNAGANVKSLTPLQAYDFQRSIEKRKLQKKNEDILAQEKKKISANKTLKNGTVVSALLGQDHSGAKTKPIMIGNYNLANNPVIRTANGVVQTLAGNQPSVSALNNNDSYSTRQILDAGSTNVEGAYNTGNGVIDFLNPLNIANGVVQSWASAPLEAQQSNSYLPYAAAAGNTYLAAGLPGTGKLLRYAAPEMMNTVDAAKRLYGRKLSKSYNNFTTNTGEVIDNLGNRYLPNAYKLNPWAFKPQEGMMYRGIGEEGMKDALESGVFRPASRSGKKAATFLDDAGNQISLKKSFDKTYYSPDFRIADRYGKGYIAEVPANSADFSRRYNKDWSWLTNKEIPINEGRILQKDWLKGYKEVPKELPSFSNVDFSKYLTQEEAVTARAERMLSQKNKWVGQPENLTYKFENALQNHNPSSSYPASKLGRNTGNSTEISSNANLSEANKARVAAHETGHYYRPLKNEGDQWNNSFNWDKIKGKNINSTDRDIRMAKEYLSGKGYYKSRSSQYGDEIRERAAQLKDYIAQKNNIPLNKNFEITESQLNDAIKNYVKDTGLDNSMSQMLGALTNKKEFLKNMNKYALGTLPIGIGVSALNQKQEGGMVNDNNGYLISNLHNFTPKKIIKSNHITTQGMAFPIKANGVPLYPNTGDYIFPTNRVVELPMFQGGGPILNNRSMLFNQMPNLTFLPLDRSREYYLNNKGKKVSENKIGIGDERGEWVIPTTINGMQLSEQDAIDHFYQTGEHMGGPYETIDESNKSAESRTRAYNGLSALENYKNGGIPDRYKKQGFTRVGQEKDSTRPGKKWMVLAKKGDSYKVVHGGDSSMQDYTQHHDNQRKKNFWNRMGHTSDKFSPRYWHKRLGKWEEGGIVDTYKQGGINIMHNGQPMYKTLDGRIVKRGLWSNTYLNNKK